MSKTTNALSDTEWVTINSAVLTRSGDIVSYNIVCTSKKTIPINTEFITGTLPHAGAYNGLPLVVAMDWTDSTYKHIIHLDNGNIQAKDQIESGHSIRFTMTYAN